MDVLLEREQLSGVSAAGSVVARELASLPRDERRSGLLAYVRGRAFEEDGQLAAATEQFEEARRSEPDEVEPVLALGRVLVAAGRVTDAESRLGEALLRSPRDQSLWTAWVDTTLVHGERTASEALTAFPARDHDRLRGFAADLYFVLRTLTEGRPLRINCGSYRDASGEDGVVWSRDRFSVGRSVVRPVGGGTADWESFQRVPTGSERCFREGAGGYSIPLPAGQYALRLWLPVAVESGEDPRSIEVIAEGTEQPHEISRQPGCDVMAEENIEWIVVKDGRLDIELRGRSGWPALSALQVTMH